MGLFSRKNDAQGLYTGDAPVSAPGTGGASPSAYQGIPAERGTTVTPNPAGWSGPSAPPYSAESHGDPAGAYGAVGPEHPFDTPDGHHAYGPLGGQGPYGLLGEQAASIHITAARPRGRASALVSIVALVAIVGAGAWMWNKFRGVIDAIPNAGQVFSPEFGAGAGPRGVQFSPTGAPVTVVFEGATLDVTVFGAELQPGNAWGYATAGDRPRLLVGAELHRTDNGADPITVTGWVWSVAGSGGTSVAGDIISQFQPSLDGPTLVGGDTVRGFVSFAADTSAVRLSLADSAFGKILAAWKLDAATPVTADAQLGEAAFATLGRPGFTVTLSNPRALVKSDKSVNTKPESGRYLLVDVRVLAIKWVEGHVGNLNDDDFVFVPEGRGSAAVPPSHTAVHDTLSFFSIDAEDPPQQAVLAFDTAAAAGTVQLRDGADRVLISWKIAAQ